jgi:copper/silver efflux system protein
LSAQEEGSVSAGILGATAGNGAQPRPGSVISWLIVVMVVYLEEALRKRMEEGGKFFSLQDLKTAVLDGAMLRLRPKVMTVGTVVASLLPIMWSTRTGAEIMKPLATPVIGGMLSSLLHVLIVTPVIFYWLRRKALKV